MMDKKEEKVIDLTDNLLLQEQFDVETNWEIMHKRMYRDRLRTVSFTWFRKIAAILLLPLLILTNYFYVELNHSRSENSRLIETFTAQGVRSRIELSDGSLVWLNSGSSLTYPEKFEGDKREVVLKGEGYFKVSADPDHRFDVVTGENIRISAYGTEFNVLAYDKEDHLKVTLSKGAVVMKQASTGQHTNLLPGEQAVYSKSSNKTYVCKVNPLVETAWKDGRIIFRKSSMNEVINLLSRKFNIEFKVLDERILNYKFSATFNNESIEEILSLLASTSPITYKLIYPSCNDDYSYTKTKVYINSMK